MRQFFMLAGVFVLVSCNSIERDNPNDPGSDNYRGYQIVSPPSAGQSSSSSLIPSSAAGSSSSVAVASSSSVAVSSSSAVGSSSSEAVASSSSVAVGSSSSEAVMSSSSIQIDIILGPSVNYQGETYETVVIGTQTWFKRNLNYNVSNSKCYNNSETNCVIYGRLYNWETAMLICPPGWHLPSNADWDKLMRYVDGSTGTSSPYDSPTAGLHLKASSGWNNDGNGQDTYGFSALPGGDSEPTFRYIGDLGLWWSSSEYNNIYAYDRYMGYDFEYVSWFDNVQKSEFRSVRCLFNTSSSSSTPPSSSSVAVSSSSAMLSSSSVVISSSSSVVVGVGLCDGFVDGTLREHYERSKAQFCDSRDGNKYVYVTIGTQTWMAENLNYNTSGSKCYGDSEDNCTTYGRLYDWATAMALPSSCNSSICSAQVLAKHRGICPSGWHIPSDAEWTALTDYVYGASTAGTKLKAEKGWGYGQDTYGFAALPGGCGDSSGSFDSVGSYGIWWSVESNASYAYGRSMDDSYANVFRSYGNKTLLYSVRCVQD